MRNIEKRKEACKKYYEKNKDKFKTYRKSYYQANKETVIEYAKTYQKSNKESVNLSHRNYRKKRRISDPLFKLRENIGKTISKKLKNGGFTKRSKTYQILGCSYEEFKLHLEGQFESWMTWDNYGLYNGTEKYGWDIDHIIPSSSAKTETELLLLNHYTNLQPLCSFVNRDIKRDQK